jgi:hypothetical protein
MVELVNARIEKLPEALLYTGFIRAEHSCQFIR